MAAESRADDAVRGVHPHVVQVRALGPRALLRDGDEAITTLPGRRYVMLPSLATARSPWLSQT